MQETDIFGPGRCSHPTNSISLYLPGYDWFLMIDHHSQDSCKEMNRTNFSKHCFLQYAKHVFR